MFQRCMCFFSAPAKEILVNTGLAVGSAVVGTVVFHGTQAISREINYMSTENSPSSSILSSTTELRNTTEEQNTFSKMR